MKKQLKHLVIGAGLLAGLNVRALTPAQTALPAVATAAVPAPAAAPAAVKVAAPATNSPAVLDLHRRYALGMIETGNNDREIGGLGEVSRYQIMPSVWRQYTSSRRYQDPGTSLEVAQRHWAALYAGFKQRTHREPTDFDMYVLWNTRYGYYANRGFDPGRLNPVVRDRAERFVNLTRRERA